MPGAVVDGQDVFAIFEAAGEAILRARRGDGPTLLECQTYRYFGHFEGDAVKYRTREEEAHYKSRDCLQRFREATLPQRLLTESDLGEIDQRAREVILDATKFAEESPLPEPEDCFKDVYVSY